jgi:hypothetical protein
MQCVTNTGQTVTDLTGWAGITAAWLTPGGPPCAAVW